MKLIHKPGLIAQIKKDRLKFCLRYEDQILEDQKNIIWTDETLVILGYCLRGYRIQRTLEERFLKSIIREYQMGFLRFMFQGSFIYNRKGPYYIQALEIKIEYSITTTELIKINTKLEATVKKEQELTIAIRRIGL